jgi:2-hydroxychromene-2-carboxylate isomerase
MRLEFTFDVVCPYAYLASTQVESLARRYNTHVAWKPVLLGGLFKYLQQPARPVDSWPWSKVEHNIRDLGRQAEILGVTLSPPVDHPRRTVEAMRLLVSAPEESRPQLAKRLFAAYWQNGEDVSDRNLLTSIARELGLDPAGLDTPHAREELHNRTQEAHDQGFFGVPTLRLGEEWWWGVDRLLHVEAALSGASGPHLDPVPPLTRRTLRFFHDFSSPFAYLASTQIDRIAQAKGAIVEYVPILLGGLFRSIGTPMVPLFSMSQSKQAWLYRDLQNWAAWWEVPLVFPSRFPLRTITPARISLVEPSTIPTLYQAAWVDDLDIGNDECLHNVLTSAGFDAPALLKAANEPETKRLLKENTQCAAEAGVCGVPTFQVDEGPMFWGQDRLHMVEAALDGWMPAIDSERGSVGASR